MQTFSFSVTRGQLRAILNLAATKDVRYYLNGLCIVQDARGTIIQATDGHILGMLRVCDIPRAKNEVILPRESVKALAGTKRQATDIVEFQVLGSDVTASCAGTMSTFKAVDGKFPDTVRVIPTQDMVNSREQEAAQFDPSLVSRFADVAKDFDRKGHVWIRHSGNRSALVSIDVENFIGVIMPMRGEAPSTVPDWVHAPQSVPEKNEEMTV